MEETIGYEALLSADEWDSLDIGEWTDGDDPNDLDDFSSPFGSAAINGGGFAAPSQVEPRGASSDKDPIHLEFVHEIFCRTRNLDDGTTEYVLECDICEEIGTADEYEEADVIAQQHRTVTSESWEVG